MLTHLSVKGFKSLSDIQDLALGRINVFVGANGSGKTSILETLGILGATASGLLDDGQLARRGVRLGSYESYQTSFQCQESPETISISATWQDAHDKAQYQLRIHESATEDSDGWSYERNYLKNDQILLPESGPPDVTVVELKYPPITVKWPAFLEREPFKDFLAALGDYAIFSPETPKLRGTEPDVTQRSPVGLAGGRLAEAVDELQKHSGYYDELDQQVNEQLAEAVDELPKRSGGSAVWDSIEEDLLELLDWVAGVDVVPPTKELIPSNIPTLRQVIRFTDAWMADERNQLWAYNASEGALYVLFALVLALHPRSPRLFAIENLDQVMHPRLARALVRLFCKQVLQSKNKTQVLLTTHNPLVLDGLDLKDDRVRLFTVERGLSGATRVDRVILSQRHLDDVESGGLSVSDLWIMGRLGGVPDIF